MKLRLIAVSVMVGGLSWGGLGTAQAAPQATASEKTDSMDRDTMQKIRKSVVDDKSLSTYAHNVKIIAHDGKVTLRGPVRSEAEKHSIVEKAAAVVGPNNVTDDLTIQPSK